MSTKYNNPPAFPFESPNEIFSGMTLRDYFAAKALTNMRVQVNSSASDEQLQALLNAQAATAYRFADAMLAERIK